MDRGEMRGITYLNLRCRVAAGEYLVAMAAKAAIANAVRVKSPPCVLIVTIATIRYH